MTPTPDLAGAGECLSCVLASDPLAVRAGLARIAAAQPLAALTDDQRGTVEVVLAEVLNNIAEHAYAGGPGQITLTIRSCTAGIACQVTDTGIAMLDARLPAGDHPSAQMGTAGSLADVQLAELPEGGFGWYMIRLLTQDLSYARIGNQNQLGFVIAL